MATAFDWQPPLECSKEEERILRLCKRQKLWGFLRANRHLIIDAEIRDELAGMYASGKRRAAPPLAPERLALAMLLQVAFDVPDHEVPTLTALDRRWQMVLDCLDADAPLMSQGAVFNFRERARRHGFMDKLLEKTVRLARDLGGFSAKRLRALIDSSPLTGAGRVEDTFNLIGRAIRQLVELAAVQAGRSASELATELDVTVATAASVKGALDLDWRLPSARNDGIRELLAQFERLSSWLRSQFSEEELSSPPLGDAIRLVQEIIDQDTVPDPDPPGNGSDSPSEGTDANPVSGANSGCTERKLRQGVAADRIISISDREMRAGRKSKTKTFNGYKRHIATDADVPGLIHAVEVLPANRREYDAASPLIKRLQANGYSVVELHVDRGYLAADVVHELRHGDAKVITKPPTPPKSERYNKYDFTLDTDLGTLTCPNDISIPYKGDGAEHRFPTPSCRACPLRSRCLTPKNRYGRVIKAHEHESFFRDMHEDLKTPAGRALRRQRIPVEHALARVGQIQGRRARFRGLAKNQFDLVRTAVVANLYVIGRLVAEAA